MRRVNLNVFSGHLGLFSINMSACSSLAAGLPLRNASYIFMNHNASLCDYKYLPSMLFVMKWICYFQPNQVKSEYPLCKGNQSRKGIYRFVLNLSWHVTLLNNALILPSVILVNKCTLYTVEDRLLIELLVLELV